MVSTSGGLSSYSYAHSDAISPELLNASLEYMRTPSPKLPEAGATSQYWILDSVPVLSHVSPSPVLSCPPSWLHDENGNSDIETESDEEFLSSAVPLSSSPPDFTSPSPQSDSSDIPYDISAPLASSSDDYLTDLITASQLNSSLVDLPTGASLVYNDFGTRLHQLLLIAINERECEGQDSVSEHNEADTLSGPKSHGRGCDSADNCSSVSHEGSNENQNVSIERNPIRTPRKFSLSNGLKEVSPICSTTDGVAACHDIRKIDPSKAYRLIKRSQSYVPVENKDEPQIKRQKIARDQGSHVKDRTYAHRTASLRRAESLRSAPGDRSPTAKDCGPTVPATPDLATPKPGGNDYFQTSEYSNILMEPVPIIAPPEGHVSKLPLSPNTLAKMRLTRYLEREASGRDGILLGTCQRSSQSTGRGNVVYERPLLPNRSTLEDNAILEWEGVLGIGRKRREVAIKWLLDVLPSNALTRASSPSSCSSLSSVSSLCTSSSRESSFTLDSSRGSSSHTTNTSELSTSHMRTRSNLEDQLESSPETRFHAAWMFLSYFHLTMSSNPSANNSRSSSKDSSIDEGGLDLVVWDIALACLAISVKFHRDFLDPLLPVFAHEYVALAPHHISEENLESAHRDVLSAFDYKLGVTPQPVMDELWSALPSLRGLLDFDGGWKEAMADAWTRLFVALEEPDVQRFLVSMLTVVALLDGILEILTSHYWRIAAGQSKLTPAVEDPSCDMQLIHKKSCMKAKEDAEGVFCDIQALTGITDANLRECRLWMTRRK